MSDNKFVIPKSFISQLNEFSNGGYFLCSFNDIGDPIVHCSFDTQMHGLAMQKFMESWTKAVSKINDENFESSIIDQEIQNLEENDDSDQNFED